MFVEDCYKLGSVYKAYGIKGELIIRTDLKLSENTIPKMESIFIKINGILVPFFIESAIQKSDKELQVKLEDIEDELQSKPYIGLEVFVDKENRLSEDENLVFFEWINYQVNDEKGLVLGEMVELIEYPGHNMLVINSLEAEEVMIPAIEDWVVSVDSEKKIIIMSLPEGLFELNQKKDIF